MDFKHLLNIFFTALNANLRSGFDSVVRAIKDKKSDEKVSSAITVQTSTLKQIFTKFDKALSKLGNPEFEVKLDNKDLLNAIKKLDKDALNVEVIETQLQLILTHMIENQPERLTETFDAFGKSILELKPKDQVTIDPKQIKGLMAAITNSGGAGKEAPNGGLYSARAVVVTAGTAVKLSSTKQRCENITITAESDNMGIIAVGDSSVVAAEGTQQGAILTPLGSVTVKVGDLSKIYIDATVNGDGVSIAYEY